MHVYPPRMMCAAGDSTMDDASQLKWQTLLAEEGHRTQNLFQNFCSHSLIHWYSLTCNLSLQRHNPHQAIFILPSQYYRVIDNSDIHITLLPNRGNTLLNQKLDHTFHLAIQNFGGWPQWNSNPKSKIIWHFITDNPLTHFLPLKIT